jgi:hypothetical protein
MRILSVGNFGTGWDGSICDEEHIAQALEVMGHEVYRWSRQDIEDDINHIQGRFDFVLVAQYDGYPKDLTRHLIKRYTNAPVVYWAFDYQADGQEWHERLVEGADLYLSKRLADVKYPNWRWLSQDFSPMFLDSVRGAEKDIDVLFTGSYLDWAHERNETLKAVDDRFNLHIYGVTPDQWKAHGFKNVHGPVMDDALPALIARAKINLSIDHTIEAGYWSDRNAQIMACSGFVLFREVPMSRDRFKCYVDYFSSVGECVAKISYWLMDEHQFTKNVMEAMAYQYAHQSLKVDTRVREMLELVKEVM